ncbi:N-acetylmuramoyl-L-alanine amidase [bacterium]|nr:N-acetylmuramoyl-L-alanine amidase [bacterium]
MKEYKIALILFAFTSLLVGGQFPTEYITVSHRGTGQPGYFETDIARSPIENLTGFALRLTGEMPPGTKITASIYWSGDGKSWEGPLIDDEIGPNDEEGPKDGYLYGDFFFPGDTPAHNYRAEFRLKASGNLTPRIDRVEFVFMDCGTTEYPLYNSYAAVLDYPMPPYISRYAWSCPIPDTFASGVPYYVNAHHIVTHHTAGATSTPSDPAATVRGIWNYHVNTRGWNDIGYNFLLDHLGNIYEGRYCADLANLDVQGAHVSGHNTGAMGYSVLGNFEVDTILHATLPAIYSLLAWKCDQRELDPHGTGWHVDGTYNIICGHRDMDDTDCPGANFYPMLPMIRDSVANRLSYIPEGTDSFIVDNGNTGFRDSGEWIEGSWDTTYGWDNDYQYCNAGGAPDWATWTPTLPSYAAYNLYMWWYAGDNRCNNVFVMISGEEPDTILVSQRGSGAGWHLLGNYLFLPGDEGYVEIRDHTATDGSVIIADAVKWVLTEELGTESGDAYNLPECLRLYCYPNPFNSKLQIEISNPTLDNLTPIKIQIHDLRGRTIASLCHTDQTSTPSPENTFEWEPNASISSGVYLINVNWGFHNLTGRVVYLK